MRKRYGWELARNTSSVHLRTATGNSPAIEGEVHNVVVRLAEGIDIPLNVVSIANLDVDFLMGRPFLEILDSLTHNRKSLYHMRWNNRWLTVDGETGYVETQRMLSIVEREDWQYGRPPRYEGGRRKPQIEEDSDDGHRRPQRKSRQKAYKISLLTSNHGPQWTIEEDHGYDLEQDLLTGEVSIKDIHQLITHPAPPARKDPTPPRVHGPAKQLRIHLLESEPREVQRVFLSRISGHLSGRDIVQEVWEPRVTNKLNLVSWNVNSVRNLLKRTSEFVVMNGSDADAALGVFLERHAVDVFCVQEHRLTNIGDAKPCCANVAGYTAYFTFADNVKGYSGVAIYARDGLATKVVEGFQTTTLKNLEGRILQCHLTTGVVVINIYVPNARNQPPERADYKRTLLNALEAEIQALKREGKRVVVMGDWNMVYRKEDIWNPREMAGTARLSPCAEWEERWVQDFIINNALVDAHIICNQKGHPRFSAWEMGKIGRKTRRELNRGFRIDYALVGTDLQQSVRKCHLKDYPGSDHIPVFLQLAMEEQNPYRAKNTATMVPNGQNTQLFKLTKTVDAPPAVRTIAGAQVVWEPFEGKTPTPTRQMNKELTGERQINIGDVPELIPYVEQIEELFLRHLPEILGPGEIARTLTGVEEMTAKLDPSDTSPLPKAKVARWSETEEKVLNEYDDKMTAAGKLEPSTSNTSARPLLVPKKDASWRIVFNFSPINR